MAKLRLITFAMKRKVFILGLLSVLILGIVSISYSYVSFRNKTELLKKIKFSKINNGDLILRCGRSTESYTVYLVDSKTEFTHIGIVSIENGIHYVIHAVPHKNNFIKKERLSKFLNPKYTSKFAVYRTNFSSNILTNVVNEAQKFYTKKYTFDNEYNLKTNSKLYCSELILKAFNKSKIELDIKTKDVNFLLGKHAIIFPSEFTKLPFKRIKIN